MSRRGRWAEVFTRAVTGVGRSMCPPPPEVPANKLSSMYGVSYVSIGYIEERTRQMQLICRLVEVRNILIVTRPSFHC